MFPPRVQGETGKLPYLLLCWLVSEGFHSLYRFYLKTQFLEGLGFPYEGQCPPRLEAALDCSGGKEVQITRVALATASLRVSTVSVLFLFLSISISVLVGSAVLLDDLFYFVQQEV